MFLKKTLNKFLAMTLVLAMAVTLIPTALAANTRNAVSEMLIKIYEYDDTTPDADGIGTIGKEIVPDPVTKLISLNPNQKVIAQVNFKEFERQFGLTSLSYSLNYDSKYFKLMHSSVDTDAEPDDVDQPGTYFFTSFMGKVFDKMNANGKFKMNNTSYVNGNRVFKEITDDNSDGIDDVRPSKVEGIKEIFIYSYNGANNIPADIYKPSNNDSVIGSFLFEVLPNPEVSAAGVAPLSIASDVSSIDMGWFTSNDVNTVDNIVNDGSANSIFDTIFKPIVNPPISVPKNGYIKPVNHVYTSADDPRLNNITTIAGMITEFLPTEVVFVNSNGTEDKYAANWSQVGTDAINVKGGTYTFRTNIAGLKSQLTSQQIVVSPVFATMPLEVRSQTLLVRKASVTTWDELLALFPAVSGRVVYNGSLVGNAFGPNYTIAYTPNTLPADWTAAVDGKVYPYKGDITLAPSIPTWATVRYPNEITIKVQVKSDTTGETIDPSPLPEIEKDKFGFKSSADDVRFDTLTTLDQYVTNFLSSIVTIKDANGDKLGYRDANWVVDASNPALDRTGKTYTFTSNVEGIAPGAQIKAYIIVTPVTGVLDTGDRDNNGDIFYERNIFFDKNTVKKINNFSDLEKHLQQPGDLDLTGAKSGTRIGYSITWTPNTIPADFQTVSKTHDFLGSIALDYTRPDVKPGKLGVPVWLTGAITESLNASAEVDTVNEITSIIDGDQTNNTSADDSRVNSAKTYETITKKLLIPVLTVQLADKTEKQVPANWTPVNEVDSVVNLKGKAYNMISNIDGISNTITPLSGIATVTSVTADPGDTYKKGKLEVGVGLATTNDYIYKRLPQGSEFINVKGGIATTPTPKYEIIWDNGLAGFNPGTLGSKATVNGTIDPLSALWLTYTDDGIAWEVTVVQGPSIDLVGNDITDLTNGTLYMYQNRGFRDSGWKITDADGNILAPTTFSVVRTSYTTDADGNKVAASANVLPAYASDEDIVIRTGGKNEIVGKYIIEYAFTIDGIVLTGGKSRNLNIINLRGDLNKDGIINGSASDKTAVTDMGYFNAIIRRTSVYDNTAKDADYIGNLTKQVVTGTTAYPATGLNGNPTLIFKSFNQERLDKMIKKVAGVGNQYFSFLIPTEDAYTNSK